MIGKQFTVARLNAVQQQFISPLLQWRSPNFTTGLPCIGGIEESFLTPSSGVGAAHLPGMEAMWKEESWRDMVSPSSGDAAAWQSCLWDSPAEGAPLDQPDQLGTKSLRLCAGRRSLWFAATFGYLLLANHKPHNNFVFVSIHPRAFVTTISALCHHHMHCMCVVSMCTSAHSSAKKS